ncbi:hypothetical protein [Singulisphaera sp. PoT]|uniref:hypothetical protein n=1 Tax=Singulisphaera sp. PoT TaxID=3411797 RepID=UPI003BF536EA
MARKKADKPESGSAGFAIRGSLDWHAWVLEFAKFRRLKVTDLIDQSLVEAAEKHGFTKPAPER